MAIQYGPTPWWQLPEYKGSRASLESSAPDGYEYDPVQMQYARTPAAAGQRVADFNDAALGSSLSALKSVANGSGASPVPGGSSVQSFSSTAPINSISAPAAISPIDTTAADDAAFGRAKELVGQSTRGAVASLRSALAGRGLLGSGIEGKGTTHIAEQGLSELTDVARDRAIHGSDAALDVAKSNQASSLTQRSQDISLRGQDISAQQAEADRAQRAAIADSQMKLDQLRAVLGLAGSTHSFLY